MKTIQKRWLSLFLLAAVTFIFPACEGNLNDPDEYPEGFITLKMRNEDEGGTTITFFSGKNEFEEDYAAYLTINASNNFIMRDGQICDAGQKKLGAVKKIPQGGWTEELAVLPQHTYVIRVGGIEAYSWTASSHYTFYPCRYYKLYVTDYILSTMGGIIGAEVQYGEWNPDELNQQGQQSEQEEPSITLNLSETTLQLSQYEQALISAEVTPKGTPITWESSNLSAVYIQDFVEDDISYCYVVGLSSGNAVISAKAGDLIRQCEVTVRN